MSSRPSARLRLICFPYAAGSYATFRGWSERLPPAVEVWGVCLPGHVGRLTEPPRTDLIGLAIDVAEALEASPFPTVLFGHSMGGLIAYEVARHLTRSHQPPLALFVAGRAGPRHQSGETPITPLDDASFVREVQARYGGLSDEVLLSPEIMDLFLPVLRADIRMMECYQPGQGSLTCPLHVFSGSSDPLTADDTLEQWRAETSGPFRIHRFDGGHFFIDSARQDLLAVLRDSLLRLG
jgi:medium-chain acyl-[acyl-carrier-protein] hydrolase